MLVFTSSFTCFFQLAKVLLSSHMWHEVVDSGWYLCHASLLVQRALVLTGDFSVIAPFSLTRLLPNPQTCPPSETNADKRPGQGKAATGPDLGSDTSPEHSFLLCFYTGEAEKNRNLCATPPESANFYLYVLGQSISLCRRVLVSLSIR
jgi:hypothetical protein